MKKQKLLALLLAAALLGSVIPGGWAADAADPQTAAIPPLLTQEHFAFMTGTGTGTFEPSKPLTRSEAAAVIYNLMDPSVPVAATKQFTDVPAGRWDYEAATALGSLGIARPDSSFFQGEDPISRGEFVHYVMAFFPLRTDAEPFPDVSADTPYAADILSARAYGIANGDDKGDFRPSATITRCETAALINQALGRTADRSTVQSARPAFFLDVPVTAWYYYDVMEASVAHTYAKADSGAETWSSWTAPETTMPASFCTTGFHILDGWSCYFDGDKGDILRNTTLNKTFTFDSNGHQTTGDSELDQGLRKIILSVCKSSMTQEEMRKELFAYCRDNYTYRKSDVAAKGQYTMSFVLSAAKKMIANGKGNCYNFSSVYFFLMRWIGFTPTAYSGTLLGDPHSWVEMTVDGVSYIYDTQMAWRHYHDKNRPNYIWYFYQFKDKTGYWKYKRIDSLS